MSEPENTPQTGERENSASAVRDGRGRFVKGAPSPNPGGRPKSDGDLVELARAVTPETFDFVLQTMRNSKASRRDRLRCAELLLAYGHGRPPQAVELAGAGGKPLEPPRFAITFPDGGPGADARDATRAYLAFVAGGPQQPGALPGPCAPARIDDADDDVEVSAPSGRGDEHSHELPVRDQEPATAETQPASVESAPSDVAAPASPGGSWGRLLAVAHGPEEVLEGVVETRDEIAARVRTEQERRRADAEEFNNRESARQRRELALRAWNQDCETALLEGRPLPARPPELLDQQP